MSKVEWKKLSDVFDIKNGYTPSKNVPEYWDNGTIPWFRMEDIRLKGGILSDSIQHISPEAVKSSGLFPANTIIVATTATIGEHALVIVDSLANQQFTALSCRKSLTQSVLPRFAYYYCFKLDDWCKTHIRKGGFASVDMDGFKKYPFPVPSLSEQNRIVGILDTFTASIDNLKEQIALRRKQYEYYRDQLLDLEGKEGVEMKTIGDIAKYRRGSFPQPYGNSEWYGGEGAMPFVQVADVEEVGMKLKDTTKQYISRMAMPKSVFVPSGSVIVTLQGSIGKVAITQYDSYVDRTLGIFEGYRIDINKKYFAHQLECVFSEKRKKARGGTIKTITKEEFTNFTIPVPSTISQQLIVDILGTFEESIQNLEAQLAGREKQYEYYRNKLLTFE